MLTDGGDGDPEAWLARAWPWLARATMIHYASNKTVRKYITLGTEAGFDSHNHQGPGPRGENTEPLLETYLNRTAGSQLLGYRPETGAYYNCGNAFNGFCPLSSPAFAIFDYESYKYMTDRKPCASCGYRQPRAVWFYETDTLLFSERNRTEFISWCKTRSVTQLYLDGFGLPGCHACPASGCNATTVAAFRALVAELHSSKIDVQVYVGDGMGSDCPHDNQSLPHGQACNIYACTCSAVSLAAAMRGGGGSG